MKIQLDKKTFNVLLMLEDWILAKPSVYCIASDEPILHIFGPFINVYTENWR